MIDYLDLNGYRLHDTETRALSAISGLTGIPGARASISDRPEDDGGVESPRIYMTPRSITLEGELWGSDEAAAWSQWDDLVPVFEAALRRPASLTWRKMGGAVDLETIVRLVGDVSPKFTADEDGPRVVYQAQFRAADPRHYSRVERLGQVDAPAFVGGFAIPLVFPLAFTEAGLSGGELTVTNAGNTKTWPVLTIEGPIVQPVIENVTRGQRLTFDGRTLAAGEFLVVSTNPAARYAVVGSENALADLDWLDSTFFPISARASETIRFYGLGGGYADSTRLSVTLRDAFIS